MNLSVGIVGFPNAGKSTLFNALLKKQIANTAPYPFCTIEPNKGVVAVPDKRLKTLAQIVKTEKIVPAVVEFVDIAGLVKGAHQGEGLGNKFLGHIQETNLILFLLRGFELETVDKVGSTSPLADLKALQEELMLKDLDVLEKQKEPKGAVSKEEKIYWQAVLKAKRLLEQGKYLADFLSEGETSLLKDKNLLTAKKYLLALNVKEKDLGLDWQKKYQFKQEFLLISAKTEEELVNLNPKEQKEYLQALGLKHSGLERLIKKAYQQLDLISFLTVGPKEVRAWTIKKGTKAQKAAGVIHTDFSQKFIKAKVVSYADFIKYGGWQKCQEKGLVRFEGKDYCLKDGEVVEFMVGK